MKQVPAILVLMVITCLSQAQPVHVSSGSIRKFENFPSKFVSPRTIDVWLPDGYSPSKKYAVLYMHDGQMLFDSAGTWNHQEWGVDETLGKLMAEKKIRECIVAGIYNHGELRHAEYFPQKAASYVTRSFMDDLLAELKTEPLADRYLHFLVSEVKPFIDSAFSTRKDRKNTFIAGSSMGGLISLYAICEYPDVFGGAACLSTHWTVLFREENNPVPDAIMAYLKNNLPSPRGHRIYFDHGTTGLDSLYAASQVKADMIMRSKGYSSTNWQTLVFEGADHTERDWNRRFSIPALFLLK